MVIKKIPYLCIALTALLIGSESAHAEDAKQNTISSTYDKSAVSSLLLAAGMYGGLKNDRSPGVSLSFGESKDLMKGLLTEQGKFDGQDITLSYKGSAGRLGFSAGYIYTTGDKDQERGSVLLGLDNYSKNTLNNIQERPWYVTLDLSRSFQLNSNLAVGVGSKTVLLANNPDEEDSANKAASMSLYLPVSYKGFLTVTPEFQWSRALLTDDEQGTRNDIENFFDPEDGQNAFYGGMSISFSY
ncbi:Outer membrane protein beta-barrel domain-containing protein [Candidatus Electrothrix laxa]